jgi:transcriptional regulator with XRE-family HTH domain/two-component sensor histidine kinase
MYSNIGQIIKILRKERNLTQEELAEKIHVTSQAVSKWENEIGLPDITQIAPLAKALKVSADVLLDIDNEDDEVANLLAAKTELIRKSMNRDFTFEDYLTFGSAWSEKFCKLRDKYPQNGLLFDDANLHGSLRVPINAMIWTLEFYAASNDDARKKQYLNTIRDVSRHLVGSMNDIFDMTNIEDNKFEISEYICNIREIIENMTNKTSAAFLIMEAKKQHFTVNISSDMPDTVTIDGSRLAQALMNLLSNAIKFTPEKGRISLSVEKVSEDARFYMLKFTVKDNGIGMSEEEVNRLFRFHLFNLAEKNPVRKFGGNGLGLPIAKRIAELMGGDIEVESEAGKGSSFIFTISAKKCKI